MYGPATFARNDRDPDAPRPERHRGRRPEDVTDEEVAAAGEALTPLNWLRDTSNAFAVRRLEDVAAMREDGGNLVSEIKIALFDRRNDAVYRKAQRSERISRTSLLQSRRKRHADRAKGGYTESSRLSGLVRTENESTTTRHEETTTAGSERVDAYYARRDRLVRRSIVARERRAARQERVSNFVDRQGGNIVRARRRLQRRASIFSQWLDDISGSRPATS